MPEYTVTLTEAERNAILGAMYWSEHVELLAKLRAAAPADASLLDRLHAAEARVAILESKWAGVPWHDVRATIVCARHWTPHQENGLNFTEDHRMFDRLTAWVQANRPQEAAE